MSSDTASIVIAIAETAAVVTVAAVGVVAMRRHQHAHAREIEENDQKLAQLRRIDNWLRLALDELAKVEDAAQSSATEPTFDYPPCPICRSNVFTFDLRRRDTDPALVFLPCGCRAVLDTEGRRVVDVRPGEDNQ